MKKLIITLLILLASTNCLASSEDGDTNNDGILSGSEQYFFEHPDNSAETIGVHAGHHEIDEDRLNRTLNADARNAQNRNEQASIVNDRIAQREAGAQAVANANYQQQLVRQSMQSGNIGDRAIRDNANRQLGNPVESNDSRALSRIEAEQNRLKFNETLNKHNSFY